MQPNTSHVVLKFGGTSVTHLDRWRTIAAAIQAHLDQGTRPVVVCSAVAGISNLLEGLLEAASSGQHGAVLGQVRDIHRDLAEQLGVNADSLLADEYAELDRLTRGGELTGETTTRLQARAMAQGELMSTRLGAAWLRSQGLDVGWADARELLITCDPVDSPTERRLLCATCAGTADLAVLEALQGPAAILTQGFIARTVDGHTAR